LINNAAKPAPTAISGSPAPTAASREPAPQEDFSNIKLNLDALG